MVPLGVLQRILFFSLSQCRGRAAVLRRGGNSSGFLCKASCGGSCIWSYRQPCRFSFGIFLGWRIQLRAIVSKVGDFFWLRPPQLFSFFFFCLFVYALRNSFSIFLATPSASLFLATPSATLFFLATPFTRIIRRPFVRQALATQAASRLIRSSSVSLIRVSGKQCRTINVIDTRIFPGVNKI